MRRSRWAELVFLAEEIARNMRMPEIRTLEAPPAPAPVPVEVPQFQFPSGEPKQYEGTVSTSMIELAFERNPIAILVDNRGSYNLYVSWDGGFTWKTVDPGASLSVPLGRSKDRIHLKADGDTRYEITSYE